MRQQYVSLKYEPSSDPLHISFKEWYLAHKKQPPPRHLQQYMPRAVWWLDIPIKILVPLVLSGSGQTSTLNPKTYALYPIPCTAKPDTSPLNPEPVTCLRSHTRCIRMNDLELALHGSDIQGYLAYKKQPPPRNLCSAMWWS